MAMNKTEESARFAYLIKNQTLQAITVFILFLVIFYRDVVFYGRTFLIETATTGTMPDAGPYNYNGIDPGFVANDPGAIAWQIEPFNRFISRSVKQGDFPLWNSYAGLAGGPLLADGQTGPLEPLQFLFYFAPDRYWPFAMDLQLLIRFFIAGFGCYLFARRLNINFAGSIAAGLVFMLSSYFVTFANHPQIKTESLLPLVLYGYDRLIDLKDRRGFLLCALLVGWAIIAAMPEATFFLLFLGTLWYFFRFLSKLKIRNEKIFTLTKNYLFRYIGSTLTGLLISAAYLLPFIEFLSLAKSVHSPGSTGGGLSLSLLPGLIFQVPGILHLQVGFFAIFSLVFSLINLKDTPKDRHIVFFCLYATVLMLTVFDFPLTNWIRQLPILNQLVFWKYPIPSIVFCVAILVGNFIDRAEYFLLSYSKTFVSLLIVFTFFIALPILGNPSKSSSAYFGDNSSQYRAIGLIVGVSLTLFLLAFLSNRHLSNKHFVQIGLLILIVLEPFYWGTRINRPDRVDPYQTPPFIAYLIKRHEPFRLFGLDGTLYPNISTAYKLSDIRWLNALVPQRVYDFTVRFLTPDEPNTIRFTGTKFPVSDRMFNLLNVKNIVSENSIIDASSNCVWNIDSQPNFGMDLIQDQIIQQNVDKGNQLPEARLNINGAARTAILVKSPGKFTAELTIPDTVSKLLFSIGLDPHLFQPGGGDGVNFVIRLEENNVKTKLFSKYIDPKNNPCDRKWFDEDLDLTPWAGKKVILTFLVEGKAYKDNAWGWAAWGGLQLKTLSDRNSSKEKTINATLYQLDYLDQDVQIYQNENALPRAFVVYDVVNVPDLETSMKKLSDANLEFGQTAVVENLPSELVDKIGFNQANSQTIAGQTNRVSSGELEVIVGTKTPGLLVLSEQYYPGWKAFVDGKRVPIYAVDGIFRGVFLEAGNHIVEFKYQPLSFIIGAVVSLSSLLTIIFFLYKPLCAKNM